MKLAGRSFFTFREFICNIHKKYHYQNKGGRYLNICRNFPVITHFSNFLSNQIVITKKTIPRIREKVKLKTSEVVFGRLTLGPTKLLINQPAEILTAKPENALINGRNFFFAI